MLVVRALASIIILPGIVVLVVPIWMLRESNSASLSERSRGPGDPLFWLSSLLLAGGFSLLHWTIVWFARSGRRTLAPWDPPRRLVLDGPYRHVRNPMITGVVLTFCGEAMLFQLPAIATRAVLFFTANAIYFPLVEEPGLRSTFGDDYSRYCAHVPRWRPRLRAWNPSGHRESRSPSHVRE